MKTLSVLNRYPRTLEHWFDPFFKDDFFMTPHKGEANRFTVTSALKEAKDRYLLTVDLPGVSKSDIQIEAENNVLTIKGERKTDVKTEDEKWIYHEHSHGEFSKSFQFPENVNFDQISAEFKDGVLSVTLPKRELPQPRTVEIQ